MARRSWVKLWAAKTLQGSTFRELKPDERAVWFGFLCMGGDSPIPGLICAAEDVPYTPAQLTKILVVPPPLLRRATDRMIEVGKISVNGQGIHITNWPHYQGDYERVRKHRERVSNETPNPECFNGNGPKEKEKEKENIEREGEGENPPPPEGGGVFERLLSLTILFEREIGEVTPILEKKLREWVDLYPSSWIEKAVHTAVANKKPTFAYVEGVMKTLIDSEQPFEVEP